MIIPVAFLVPKHGFHLGEEVVLVGRNFNRITCSEDTENHVSTSYTRPRFPFSGGELYFNVFFVFGEIFRFLGPL